MFIPMILKSRTLKQDVLKILEPIFGDSVKKMIVSNYSENNPKELILLSTVMLNNYMGEENAKKLIDKLVKKHKVDMK